MKYVRVETIGETTYATFVESKIFDLELIDKISRELESIVDEAASRKFEIDLRKVQFMSSAMLGKLVLFNLKCLKAGSEVRFRNPTNNVRAIFRITGLDRVMRISRPSEGHSAIRFSPELFDDRNRVLEALNESGFSWLGEFSSVEPLHDIYGIEVRGISDRNDANQIQELLEHMYPDWHRACPQYRSDGREPGWRVKVHRDPAPLDDWNSEE